MCSEKSLLVSRQRVCVIHLLTTICFSATDAGKLGSNQQCYTSATDVANYAGDSMVLVMPPWVL